MSLRWVERILLYDESLPETVNTEEIVAYLKEKLGAAVRVEVKGNPFLRCPEKSPELARRLASIKIVNAMRRLVPEPEPLYGEIQYELRKIREQTKAFGVLYDGIHLLRVFAELIPREERSMSLAHVFLTNRLFATWEADQRYHARTSVYGMPSVISTSGLVEAPAKPREYYRLKQQYEMLGRDLLELNERFKGSFLGYDDPRMNEALKGYVMQAFFYALTGNPFCEDKGCRLFNAHWQEELLYAQIGSPYEFCERHASLLAGVRAGG